MENERRSAHSNGNGHDTAGCSVAILGTQDNGIVSQIRRQLEGLARLLGIEPNFDRGLALVRQRAPNVAILYLDEAPAEIMKLSSQVARLGTCVPIVVSRDRNPDAVLQAMRAGARDFAQLTPGGDDVRRAVEGLLGEMPNAGDHAHRGRLVTVFSCRGGSGATTIAVNLACALQDHQVPRVALLDISFQFGDIPTFLDMQSEYGWSDVLDNMHRFDEELLNESLDTHTSGVRVLAQPEELVEGDGLRADEVVEVIEFLRGHYDYLIVDGARDFRETSRAVLDVSDRVLVTLTQDIPALRNASQCIAELGHMGIDGDRIDLILNRYTGERQLGVDAIGDALGTRVAATVANDFRTVARSINEGAVVVQTAPRTRVAQDLKHLTTVIGAAHAPVNGHRSAPWSPIRLLGRRRKKLEALHDST
jgi:pilus assembly protein CpaE